jgi:hypothetical protein
MNYFERSESYCKFEVASIPVASFLLKYTK